MLITSSHLTISRASEPDDGRAFGQLALLRTPVGRQPLSVSAFSSLEQVCEDRKPYSTEVEAIGRVRLTGSAVRFDALRAEDRAGAAGGSVSPTAAPSRERPLTTDALILQADTRHSHARAPPMTLSRGNSVGDSEKRSEVETRKDRQAPATSNLLTWLSLRALRAFDKQHCADQRDAG